MEVTLKRIDVESRYVLENLFPYYVYDMSEFMGWNPDSNGLYTFSSAALNPYWHDSSHVPYFIYAEKLLAGFALIRKYPADLDIFDIEQFYILRKFKGQGVGKEAFMEALAHHPGKWQVRVLKENKGALRFWLSAISKAVGDNFQLALDNDLDLEMHFIRFETVS